MSPILMFPLLMTHPKHGAMYAHDHSEAERLKKAGWSEAAPIVKAEAPQKRAYRRKAA